MKTQTLKLIFLICIQLAFYLHSNAQIVYTDVIPDQTFDSTGSSYFLDLNNDGVNDFKLYISQVSNGSCTTCQGNKTSRFVSFVRLDLNEIRSTSVALNITINSALAGWTNSQLTIARAGYICMSGGHGSSCNWQNLFGVNMTDRYFPLKLKLSGQTFYGWLRLDTYSNQTNNSGLVSFTIKDFAYNSIPNQPILAGEISCAIPTVTLSSSGSLSFCAGDSVTLTANGTGYQYQWKKNGVNITGAKSQTYVAKTAGTYKCKVTNSCGSKTSGGKTVTVPCRLTNEVFTEQLENPYELKIAPNPLSTSTTISFSLTESQNVSMNIVDLYGRLIQTLADNIFEEGKHSTEWNADKVNAGIYFLQFQSEENLQTEKLIVTK